MTTTASVAMSKACLAAYSAIPKAQQKKVREFIEKFEADPTSSGINYEKVNGAKDPKVRSVRIDQAYRAIVIQPPKNDVYTLVWVAHHDDAYDWVKDRIFEVNPASGGFQIYNVPEVVQIEAATVADHQEYLFGSFDEEDLMLAGVPRPLLPAVQQLITPKDLDDLAEHLPVSVTDVLYMLAAGYGVMDAMEEMASRPDEPVEVDTEDFVAAMDRPQSQATVRLVASSDDLEEMLDAPLEQWRIFLHPAQRRIVRMNANGPVRILGGAGTGKTVCLMHRARYLLEEVLTSESDTVLVTTFTRNLAMDLEANLRRLCGNTADRMEVQNLHSWAVGFLKRYGQHYKILAEYQRRQVWDEVTSEADRIDLPASFYEKEWDQVVMAQNIEDLDGYFTARRVGRGVRLGRKQRADVWEVFERYRNRLEEEGRSDWQGVIREARLLIERRGVTLPYKAILVDEVQDFTPQELLLLRCMIPEGPHDLFLVGDAHQRIYGSPYRLSEQGINIRGRSRRLRVNYRTTHEIGRHALSVLHGVEIDDLDGGIDTTKGYRSLRAGLPPVIETLAKETLEAKFVRDTVQRWLEEGVRPEDICVSAREGRLLKDRYRTLLEQDGIPCWLLEKEADDPGAHPGVRLATMHRMKGLEFRKVLLVAVQEGIVPWVPGPAFGFDEGQLEELALQERCLFYVACTRARDELVVVGCGRSSEFMSSHGERLPAVGDGGGTGGPDVLIIEDGSTRSGGLVKGYLPHWHETEVGGGYKSGYGFFWLEYEAHADAPGRVKVQVECPLASRDRVRAARKKALIELMLAERVPSCGARAELNSRLDIGSVGQAKSSTVWVLTWPGEDPRGWQQTAEAAIRKTHAALGVGLDRLFRQVQGLG